MITKEEFANLISEHQKWDKRINEVGDVLNCFMYELDWVEYGAFLFDKTLKLIFNENGIDDINWWLFDKAGRDDMKMWDANGIEIPTKTIDDLWEIVKDSRI